MDTKNIPTVIKYTKNRQNKKRPENLTGLLLDLIAAAIVKRS